MEYSMLVLRYSWFKINVRCTCIHYYTTMVYSLISSTGKNALILILEEKLRKMSIVRKEKVKLKGPVVVLTLALCNNLLVNNRIKVCLREDLQV